MPAEPATPPTRTSPGLVATGRERWRQLKEWALDTILGRIWERMLEIRFVDRSVALGGKAFISFFPLIIVVAAFLPAGTRASVLGVVTHRLGITGSALTITRKAFASADDTRRATGLLGLGFAIFYASSFTAALQRAYLDTWRRPKDTMVGSYTRGILWCMFMIAYAALQGAIRWMFAGAGGLAVFVVVAMATTVGVWWLTSWLMLAGKVRPRLLLPTGIVTGLAMALYAAAAQVWMPDKVRSYEHQFGFFGVALALVTWLSGAATCVVLGACTGAVLVEDQGRIGRFARGRDGDAALAAAKAGARTGTAEGTSP